LNSLPSYIQEQSNTDTNGTLKLFYSNNAIPVLHHRPFLFGFILRVTFVTCWSCFYNCKHWTLWTYELMSSLMLWCHHTI